MVAPRPPPLLLGLREVCFDLSNHPRTAKICYTAAMKVCGRSLGSRKCAQDKISGPFKRIVLIAGMGTSPAVLTETEFEGELT